MKTNPQGTGFPITSINPQMGISRRQSFYSPKPLSRLPGVRASFFPRQAKVAMCDPMLSPRPSDKISFHINLDRPTFPSLSVTRGPQGQIFHHNSPQGELLPNLTVTLRPLSSLSSQACFLPPLTTVT